MDVHTEQKQKEIQYVDVFGSKLQMILFKSRDAFAVQVTQNLNNHKSCNFDFIRISMNSKQNHRPNCVIQSIMLGIEITEWKSMILIFVLQSPK